MLLELAGPFLFWANSLRVRRLGVALFLTFHVYSGVVVGIWYTTLMIPFLLLLFADGFAQSLSCRPPGGGWQRLALACMTVGALWPFVIPGDTRITGEGRYLGLFMFDANHRSRVRLEVQKAVSLWEFQLQWDWPNANNGQTCQVSIWKDGVPQPVEPQAWNGRMFFHPNYFQSLSTRVQNDPYVYYNWARGVVGRIQPERVGLQLWSQLDGHPQEFQTLDIQDFQTQVKGYNPYWHNPWIRLPGSTDPAFYRWY